MRMLASLGAVGADMKAMFNNGAICLLYQLGQVLVSGGALPAR